MSNDPGFWEAQDAAEAAFRARPDDTPQFEVVAELIYDADTDRIQEWRDEDREWRK